MPIPIDGLVPVAEFGTKFEADVATNRLVDRGIAAMTSYDPALNSVASYFASDRTVEVVVRADDVNRARTILDEADDDLPEAFRAPDVVEWRQASTDRRVHRSESRRLVAVVLLVAVFVIPLLVGLVSAIRS